MTSWADLRRGEEISISEAGQDYRVKLIDRPAMTLFGQAVEMHPQRPRKDLGKMARAIGTAAVRRGKGEIKGPLTLVFNDLTESNAEKLKAGVAFRSRLVPPRPGATRSSKSLRARRYGSLPTIRMPIQPRSGARCLLPQSATISRLPWRVTC